MTISGVRFGVKVVQCQNSWGECKTIGLNMPVRATIRVEVRFRVTFRVRVRLGFCLGLW